MIDCLTESIADFYVRKNVIQANEKDVYKFGIYLILNDILTFSLVLILSALFFKFRFGVEFLISFCCTRFFWGGYHAKKASFCRLSMIAIWLCILLISLFYKSIHLFSLLTILFVSFLLALPLIPVKHPNKVLTEKLIKRGKVGGTLVYCFFSICSVISFMYIDSRDAIVIALSLSAVSVLVIIGKFINERRGT